MAEYVLDFEKDIVVLEAQIAKMKEKEGADDNEAIAREIAGMEKRLDKIRAEVYANLSGWQKVQVSRHPDRPYTLDYIEHIFTDFIELHGDRLGFDDKAIVGGWAKLDGQPVMLIGHQKGKNTKTRQYRNFGMANPEGYRKALRLMKMAEKFDRPVITMIDTPGAYPGLEAEERGQGEAIARNLREMAVLKVPIVCVVIGEGASGGALGIGVGDRVLMMENTWYSVISPESCSSILWRNWDNKEIAAEALNLTADKMLANGLIDGIIKEPLGGAHADHEKTYKLVKAELKRHIKELKDIEPDQLVMLRIDKFSHMGHFQEG
ncbi:MAG: acetyl-CoA carboxylase carboxyltransferase subunit alpha [Bacteroidetes bacterium]|jgi:acetyl-CoA carboxylase carboxyl transferase subunit alpha|nr:acetyl-CoA carboxylase carboxyltransferase subunit alpha [Bacteroidota bacterium]